MLLRILVCVPLRLRLQLKTGSKVLAGAENGTYGLHNEVQFTV
jgi:hypothetical protein